MRHGIYLLTLLAGAVLGYFFGDYPFPALEEFVGDPLCDILMAIGGLAVAAVLYEIATSLATRRLA